MIADVMLRLLQFYRDGIHERLCEENLELTYLRRALSRTLR